MGFKQRQVFLLTYLIYVAYYLFRLNFSIALPGIESDLKYTKTSLGFISAAFSFFYAIGQFVNGRLVNRVGARRLIFIGLTLSIAMNWLFGCIRDPLLSMVVRGVNGYAQSTGWPSVVKIISDWFRSSEGTVGGIFGTCFLVGNMVAWSLLGYIMENYGWQSVFWAPSSPLVLVMVIFYLGVHEKNRSDVEPGRDNSAVFRRFLPSKEIMILSLAFMLLQMIRSGFTLWIPSYLFETWNLRLELTGYIASIIPFGGIVSSVTLGWLSDKYKKLERRKIMLLLTLLLGVILLIFCNGTPPNLQLGAILLFLFGLTLYTPLILMSTVAPLEFKEICNPAEVAGFIDGLGYIGSIFADFFIGWLIDGQGWHAVMIFLFLTSLGASLLISIFSRWKIG